MIGKSIQPHSLRTLRESLNYGAFYGSCIAMYDGTQFFYGQWEIVHTHKNKNKNNKSSVDFCPCVHRVILQWKNHKCTYSADHVQCSFHHRARSSSASEVLSLVVSI